MKLEPILTPVDIGDNQDSYVYKITLKDRNYALKIYGCHTEEVLTRYLEIQNRLATHKLKDRLPEEVYLQNELIKSMTISILSLPTFTTEGTFIGAGIRKNQTVRMVICEYIMGKTFADFSDDDFRGDKNYVAHLINNFLQNIAEYEGFVDIDYVGENVKVLDFVDGELSVIVTDVSRDIGYTVNSNFGNMSGYEYLFRRQFGNI